MNAPQILNALDVADEELLAEVDQLRSAPRKKSRSPYPWLVAAACLCLLCFGGWLLTKSTPTEPDIQVMHPTIQFSPPTESTQPSESIMLNIPSLDEITGACPPQQLCIVLHELTEENLPSGALPKGPEWMHLSACMRPYVKESSQPTVYIDVTTSLRGSFVTVYAGKQRPLSPHRLPNDPEYFYWNGVAFALTRYSAVDRNLQACETLHAEAVINDCYFIFSLETSEDTFSQNEADFTRVLQSFAESSISFEALSAAIQPSSSSSIPSGKIVPLSHEEALKSEPYGSYFLSEIPDGFKEGSIFKLSGIRFITLIPSVSTEDTIQESQSPATLLYGRWTRGYDELSWRVSELAEENKHRLTHAEDTERYDLSLYPIPRADSVPDELREVVDNPIFYAEELTSELVWARAYKSGEQGDSNGWRINFSVLYGDTVVSVQSKGVDPDWIYAHLAALAS